MLYPSRGLPLALELVNTQFALGGQPRDALDCLDGLDQWLRLNADLFDVPLTLQSATTDLLIRVRNLRSALRTVFGAAAAGEPPPPTALGVVNQTCAASPRFARLEFVEGNASMTMVDAADPASVLLACVARSAIELLAGLRRDEIGRCEAPGCVLFFVKDARRRHWCSAACGNRARVARHYQRSRHTALELRARAAAE
jgi:predicted RNA-binding Zn ribbon-like protein